MTKKETATMLLMLNTLYPRFKSETPINDMVDVWHFVLADFDFQDVMVAIKKLSYELQFPPTVHDIVTRIAELKEPKMLNDSEAYKEAIKAIQKFGMYKQQEALESMSPLTRKVVEQIGFQEICTSENIDTIRAQFRMAYQREESEIKKAALLPENFRNQLEQGKRNLLGKGKDDDLEGVAK